MSKGAGKPATAASGSAATQAPVTAVCARILDHARDLPLPKRASALASGFDLLAAVPMPVVLQPGARALIPTGLALALPEGLEGQVRGRSGLAHTDGIGVLNAPGTIDADYRGEICVILVNWGSKAFTIERAMRIAQLVIAPVSTAPLAVVRTLPQSARSAEGLGSTGLF